MVLIRSILAALTIALVASTAPAQAATPQQPHTVRSSDFTPPIGTDKGSLHSSKNDVSIENFMPEVDDEVLVH
jgi:hypothetical protein